MEHPRDVVRSPWNVPRGLPPPPPPPLSLQSISFLLPVCLPLTGPCRERESREEDIGDAKRGGGSGGGGVFLGFLLWSILNSQLLINQTNPDIQHEYCASTDAVRRLGYVLCETQSRCKNKSTKKNMMKKHWFKKRNGGSHEPILLWPSVCKVSIN